MEIRLTNVVSTNLGLASVMILFFFFSVLSSGCKKDANTPSGDFYCINAQIGSSILHLNDPALNTGILVDQPIQLTFNKTVDEGTMNSSILLSDNTTHSGIPITLTLLGDEKTIEVKPNSALEYHNTYTLQIATSLLSKDGEKCNYQTMGFQTKLAILKIDSILVDNQNILNTPYPSNINRNFSAQVFFNHSINPFSVTPANVKLYKSGVFAGIHMTFSHQDSVLTITADQPLIHFDKYTLNLGSSIQGTNGFVMSDFTKSFYTALDSTPKFPIVTDEQLLDQVEAQTFKYFWDFGHPVSGLARERNTSGDIVTIGGSGFGAMSIIVGIERGFITRAAGVDRWKKMVGFLSNNAQRYHGAWPHWLNGATGITIPFSQKDNGADLVETSYMIEGLLTVRQYLNPADPQENQLIADIQSLWESVEWDWFTRGGQNVLYWHWSPNYNWDMNFPIHGYNECLITYFLAACSPTHPIAASVYHQGWASSGNFVNNHTYYGYNLPLGESFGGPLFFAHYSYLGLDPRNLQDTYANYWTQNTHHALINQAYCIANPLHKIGYSDQCWGLTASDNESGYNAHSPTNDLGVISPTAALSSFPYTPEASMKALHFFYYQLGDKLWGNYGFYDAFNVTAGWYANSTLAIDQGPIIVMIENYRTGKLWDLFMSSPEVANGAGLLGFTY